MTLKVKRATSIKEINAAFEKAAETNLKKHLQFTDDPIVSIDITENLHSCIFDAGMTSVFGGNFVKIIGWYDKETGYSSPLIDLISLVCNK